MSTKSASEVEECCDYAHHLRKNEESSTIILRGHRPMERFVFSSLPTSPRLKDIEYLKEIKPLSISLFSL
jgi:hypothetical protein